MADLRVAGKITKSAIVSGSHSLLNEMNEKIGNEDTIEVNIIPFIYNYMGALVIFL